MKVLAKKVVEITLSNQERLWLRVLLAGMDVPVPVQELLAGRQSALPAYDVGILKAALQNSRPEWAPIQCEFAAGVFHALPDFDWLYGRSKPDLPDDDRPF